VNRYVSAIIIGAVAGIAMGFLIKAFVFPDGFAAYGYGVGTFVFIAYILSNLAGNRKVAAAGADERAQALAMRAPVGKALLIPYREGFVAKLAGLNLSIDGRQFVQLTSPKFACLAISPGRHTLSGVFGGLAGPQSKAANVEFEAPEGSVTVVRINANMGLVQGAIVFTREDDLAAARLKLERMPMASVSAG
jgi:hypothetical protein